MKCSIEQKIHPAAIFGVLTALIAYFIVAAGTPTNAAGTSSLGNATNLTLYICKRRKSCFS